MIMPSNLALVLSQSVASGLCAALYAWQGDTLPLSLFLLLTALFALSGAFGATLLVYTDVFTQSRLEELSADVARLKRDYHEISYLSQHYADDRPSQRAGRI